MDSNFQNSEIYYKALEEYQQKIYGEILNPLHVIVCDNDEVHLFYNQSIVQDIYNKILDIYVKEREGEETDFPIGLGYQEPELETITFMGVKYKTIFLWYDNCDLPDEFEAKI